MSIQSILLDTLLFSEPEAKKWIKTHGFKTHFGNKGVHITKNKYRYRQLEPFNDAKYRTKKVAKGVEFIMEYKGEKK